MLTDRIVARSDSFVAFPTIGQIVPGYLLVAPVAHVESLAKLSNAEVQELDQFVSAIVLKVDAHDCIVFEHGSTQATGGGCGIYHAHLHVLPHQRLATEDMLSDSQCHFASLSEALIGLNGISEYLLYGCAGRYSTLDISKRREEFPSQYFRRRISVALRRDDAWDWRQISGPEQALVRTVEVFKG